jgi:hypothetical protein
MTLTANYLEHLNKLYSEMHNASYVKFHFPSLHVISNCNAINGQFTL